MSKTLSLLLGTATLLLSSPASANAACVNELNVCQGSGPANRPLGGCHSFAYCVSGILRNVVSCGSGKIFDVLLERCNWEEHSFCVVSSCAPSPPPTASPTLSPSESPSASPSASPSESPTGSPSESPSESPSASPSASPSDSPSASPTDVPSSSPTGSPSAEPTWIYEFFVLSQLETDPMRRIIQTTVLQSKNPAGIAYPSKKYSYEGLMKSLREMALEGITSDGRTFLFYVSNEERVVEYGLANLALFLAMAMTESIATDTCDEFNTDEVAGRYALSNACGQNNRSYQDEACTGSEAHMSCHVDADMKIVSSGYAAGMSGRAPPPFSCRPKAQSYDYAGYWDKFNGVSSGTAYSNAR